MSAGKKSRWDKAIAALLSERDETSAALKAGISRRTLSRWQADPAFQERLRQAKSAALNGLINQLRGASDAAVAALSEVASDKKAPASARASAAGRLLELLLRGTDSEEIQSRLNDLEQLLKSKGVL
jgi:hypothetical protein